MILTLTGGPTAALVFGFITQKLKLSPIVGYLLAGIVVGPFTAAFVANYDITTQGAEIGVILLMSGVGLHLYLEDLMAVRKVAIPGAVAQIAAATILGELATRVFGWSWKAGLVFGVAISVVSTVVLKRVLAGNRALQTTTGHTAVGWLIVEDFFTASVTGAVAGRFWSILGRPQWERSLGNTWHRDAQTSGLGRLHIYRRPKNLFHYCWELWPARVHATCSRSASWS